MIPLTLHIKNFLSYGTPTQTVDFVPYQLICLSGKNGHGKSALLDALTWAVWGHARKIGGTAKADEGLIRLGQTSMMVSLDFMCNGITYRVRREFTMDRSKGTTQLDFGIIDPSSQTLHSLTDKTIRATQAKIEQTIGFDYESFINSVFLRQGNSNEFSKKSPKDRKEVLATILGLTKYELLRKQALDKVREGAVTVAHLKKNCELLQTEVAQAATIREQLTTVQRQQTELAQTAQNYEQVLQELATEKKLLAQQQQEQHTLVYAAEQQAKTIATHGARLYEIFNQWRSAHRYIISVGKKKLNAQEKKVYETELNSIQEKMNKQLVYTQELMQATAQLQTIKNKLQAEHHAQQQQTLQVHHAAENKVTIAKLEYATLKQTHTELTQKIKTHTAEIAMQSALTNNLAKQKTLIAQQEQQFERGKNFYHTWTSRGNKIATESKKNMLQQQQFTTNDAAHCPLCEQDLASTQRAFLQQKLQQQEAHAQHQLQRLSHSIPQLKQQLTQQHSMLETARKEVARMQQAEEQCKQLQRAFEELTATYDQTTVLIEKKEQELALHEAELHKAVQQKNIAHIPLDARLLADEAYRQMQHLVKLAEKNYAEHAYDKERYEFLRAALTQIHQDEQAQETLAQQKNAQQTRKEEIHQLCKEIRLQRTEQQRIARALLQFSHVPLALSHLAEKEHRLLEQKKLLVVQKEQLAHQQGALEQTWKRIEQQQILLEKEQHHFAQIENDTQEYTIISQALSKDGVQGLLIENIIPEIEAEANDLLARLTSNQAQLSIESIRDLKSGGTKETLDIKIADAVGVRPYELFSGGEAFRIDFALRLAVSKLLARRTGTSLQTLIIDEGFGSQDEEGLHHIMECLYAIQEDFAKIIIVSHLPAMKDQFPVHFHVQKAPRGSMIQVIEQG